jgi:hypothetical protein
MHLFMAREAVDKHLQISGLMIDPKVPMSKKMAALPRIGAFYARWYLGLWFRGIFAPRYREFGPLSKHLRFVERSSRKLARQIFHYMLVFRAAAERKQVFLFRVVDIANELFAMSASVSRAAAMERSGHPEAAQAVRLTDHFCLQACERVEGLFDALWHNHDAQAYRMGRAVLAGEHGWLETGVIGLGVTVEQLTPKPPPQGEIAPPWAPEALAKKDVGIA